MPKIINWDQYYSIIYQRYVEEGLPLEEVKYILEHDYKFVASYAFHRFSTQLKLTHSSIRAYRERIRLWNFPNKQNRLHQDIKLVERVRTLWSRNYSSKAMLRVLQNEGYPFLTGRQLAFVRHRNGIRLGRGNGKERKENTKAQAARVLQEGLLQGQTLRYGYIYASSFLRAKGGIFISE